MLFKKTQHGPITKSISQYIYKHYYFFVCLQIVLLLLIICIGSFLWSEFSEGVAISIKTLVYPNAYQWDWSNCDAKYGDNRTADLFDQLINVRDAFIKHNISHIVTFGTLIGAMRDNRMNKYEVDNDLMVFDESFPKVVHDELFDRGLILFFDNIWRVCKYSEQKRNNSGQAPWGDEYYPYTDIYPMDWVINHEEGGEYFESWNRRIIKRNFADTFVFTPDDDFSKKWLSAAYDDWRSYPEHKKYRQGKA